MIEFPITAFRNKSVVLEVISTDMLWVPEGTVSHLLQTLHVWYEKSRAYSASQLSLWLHQNLFLGIIFWLASWLTLSNFVCGLFVFSLLFVFSFFLAFWGQSKTQTYQTNETRRLVNSSWANKPPYWLSVIVQKSHECGHSFKDWNLSWLPTKVSWKAQSLNAEEVVQQWEFFELLLLCWRL